MVLAYEDPANIGYLPDCWNDFDHLDENTRLLRNTKAQDAAMEDRFARRLHASRQIQG